MLPCPSPCVTRNYRQPARAKPCRNYSASHAYASPTISRVYGGEEALAKDLVKWRSQATSPFPVPSGPCDEIATLLPTWERLDSYSI